MARFAREPDTAYRAAFGWRLRELRLDKAMSQEALADAATVSRRYLSGIERGEANPSLDQLVRLAKGLGLQPAQLIPDIPEPVSPRRRAPRGKA